MNTMEREDLAKHLAVDLPDSECGLLETAIMSVNELHNAVISENEAKVIAAVDKYNAVIWKMNGGTFFGCKKDDDAPGYVIERHCRASSGSVPKWGQSGEFAIEVNNIRAWVIVRHGYIGTMVHFQFHAVDLNKPFISQTGYRSHFNEMILGIGVDEAAREIMEYFLNEKTCEIDEKYSNKLSKEKLPEWLSLLDPPPERNSAKEEIPPGYVLVDVILPSQKAFLARKWADEAKAKIQKDRKKLITRQVGKSKKRQPQKAIGSDVAAALEIDTKKENIFYPGQRCQLISVHHHCFEKDVGKFVIIRELCPKSRQAWVSDDRKPTYRRNRNGKQVVQHDPSQVRTLYSYDQLRPDIEGG